MWERELKPASLRLCHDNPSANLFIIKCPSQIKNLQALEDLGDFNRPLPDTNAEIRALACLATFATYALATFSTGVEEDEEILRRGTVGGAGAGEVRGRGMCSCCVCRNAMSNERFAYAYANSVL